MATVAMNKRSAGSRYGGVTWTKGVNGKRSCLLHRAVERKNMSSVKYVLAEQLGEDATRININRITKMDHVPKPS